MPVLQGHIQDSKTSSFLLLVAMPFVTSACRPTWPVLTGSSRAPFIEPKELKSKRNQQWTAQNHVHCHKLNTKQIPLPNPPCDPWEHRPKRMATGSPASPHVKLEKCPCTPPQTGQYTAVCVHQVCPKLWCIQTKLVSTASAGCRLSPSRYGSK